MERTKYFLSTVCMILWLYSGGTNFRSEIYKAYISNDMDLWKKVTDQMAQQKTTDPSYLLELLNYQYGYIGWAAGSNHKKEAAQSLPQAEIILAGLEKSGFRLSSLNAYKSAFYAFKINLSPLKAPFLGPKSLESAKTAVKLDSTDYLGFFLLGNAYYNMPAAFGGSKKVAMEHFLYSEKLMESDREQLKEDWNYLSLLVTIGQAYMDQENFASAKTCFEKILDFEPSFLKVKDELYPKLLNRMKNAK